MADIVGATSATSQLISTVSNSGPVSALSGALGSVSSLFSATPPVQVPLPNPLASYASYEYLISLSVLTKSQLNDPTLYTNGQTLPILAKTANVDPNNRIQTAYGKFDFFIDNLVIENTIGQKDGLPMMIGNITFDVLEPYSMGLFLQSVQAIAYRLGEQAYTESPFLLKIEFVGAKENGVMSSVPKSTRYICFRFSDIEFKVTAAGTTYHCTGYDWAHDAKTSKYNQLKNEVSAQGKTIQEVLQSGATSVQNITNAKLQDLVKKGLLKDADEIAILFPTQDKIPTTGQSATSSANVTATQSTTQTADSKIYQSLGLKRNDQKQLIQDKADVNEIGACSMDFSFEKKPNAAPASEDKVWDPNKQTWVRSNIKIDPTTGALTFPQDSSITNAIVQTIIGSGYPNKAFGDGAIDDKGQRKWFNIDTQVYLISDANLKITGSYTKLIVYRVIPYSVHVSTLPMASGTKPPYAQLLKQAIKWYNYIYTGKNTEVLDFNIQFSTGFAQKMSADGFGRSPATVTGASDGSGVDKNAAGNTLKPLVEGNLNAKPDSATPASKINPSGTYFSTDRQGGSGNESASTRAARLFHEAATKGMEMMELDMRIIGDPYFLPDSGSGNSTHPVHPTQQNIHTNGSVAYQNGQVDIVVNFRTPIDINQATGMYNFGAGTKTVPVTTWSGLYYVTQVKNNFNGGKFTQQLIGNRRPNQDLPDSSAATADQLGNVSNLMKTVSDYATQISTSITKLF
jgi:hypothetical protein